MRYPSKRAVALVTVAAVGFAGCSMTDDEPRRIDPPPTGESTADPSARPEPGPTFTVHGVPQGWSRSPAGARAAAISAVSLTGEIARAGFITRGDMIYTLATDRFGPDLAAATEAQLADLIDALGEADLLPYQLSWIEVALTARVVDADLDRARVQVWSVLSVADPAAGVPRQAWRTVTLDLAWERGDWKVDAWAAEPGPTPALAPAADVSTGPDVADAAGWPRAGLVPGLRPGGGG